MAADPLTRAEAEVGRILRSFANPRLAGLHATMMAALRPQKDDFALVFRAGAAALARRGYTVFWNNQPELGARPEHTEIFATAVWSQELAGAAAKTGAFPAGYRDAARFLVPGVIWVVGRLGAPGVRRRVVVDGFVPVAGRWRWFPRPYKVLPVRSGTSGFWAE